MKKEQIDNFFVRVKQIIEADRQDSDEQLLIEFLKLSSEKAKEELGNKNIYEFQEDYNILLKDIMEQIQKSKLYEYFLQKGIEKENLKIFETVLPENAQLPVEVVKKIIKEDELLAEVDDIEELIKKTQDVEFIKKCVKDKSLNITDIIRGNLIAFTKDKEFIKECIEDNSLKIAKTQIKDLIISTEDNEFIRKCIKNENIKLESWDKVNLIKVINDEEFTKKCIHDKKIGIYKLDKIELLKTINDREFLKECLENSFIEWEYSEKELIMKSISDKEFLIECFKNTKIGLEKWRIIEVIQSINDKEFTRKCIQDEQLKLNSKDKLQVIQSLNDEEFTKECICEQKLGLNSADKTILIQLIIDDKEFIKRLLEDSKIEFDTEQKTRILLKVDDNEKIEILKKIGEKRGKITNRLRLEGGFNNLTSEDNIKLILQWENVQNAEEKLKVLLRMKEKNQEILQKIDFEILEERYLKTLGEEKINFISNFPDIQEQILKLNQNELIAYNKIIESYEKEDKNGWRYLSINILNNISSYNSITSEIDNCTKEDIEALMLVMQNKNNFELKNLGDLRNYKEIRQKKCDEWINESGEIIRKKEALLYKIFGQDINYTEKILRQYGQDVESIENQDLKSYILALKEIMEISENKLIEKIYQQVPEMLSQDVNKILMETSIANEYGKLYNKTLLKVENLEQIEENVYDAGTDFNILMTSIGAYYINNDIDNYKKDWNRPSLNSPHISCSYIRNDMMGTASIQNICYGFSKMEEYSLVGSNCKDIDSSVRGFISSTRIDSKFYSPDNQINNTERYNEMDYARFQNGEKKQPDYIIVFKENGQVQNLEEAKKASKDWGGMPIVVVDKDRCLEAEKSRLDNLLDKYIAGDKTLAREIYYKIRNNRVTRKAFAEEINIDEFKREMEEQEKYRQEENSQEQIKSNGGIEVTKEDMQKNSEQVTAEERKQEMSKMKQLYLQIHSIAKEDKDVELE